MSAAADGNQDARAVSTVLDVAVFLLLVSAAVGTLHLPAGAGDPPPSGRADATADALATGTTSVEYELAVPARPGSDGSRQGTPNAVRVGGETVAVNASAGPETLTSGRAGPREAVGVRVVDWENATVARADLSVERAILGPDAVRAGPASGERVRVAHGGYAGLLAEAAVENATLDGRALSNASDGFERRVAAAVVNATNATGGRVRVRAVWTPYRGAPVRGVATAGREPPPDTAVAAATVRVPARFPESRERALRAAEKDGYEGVARVVSGATVRGWFPPDEARLALHGDYPVDTLLRQRYLRTAALLGTNVSRPVAVVQPRAANRRLSAALATRLERDLRERFDSPTAAARAVRVGEVRVVVRAW